MPNHTEHDKESAEIRANQSASREEDTGLALLALVDEIFGDVPDEEWEKLPKDMAHQHDHYLYGTPRRQP